MELLLKPSSTEIGAVLQVICETCGESKEADSQDVCGWCRSREKEISEIWNRWGFDREGLPLSGTWDSEAPRRAQHATQAVDSYLEELGFRARWIEMWWGFGKDGRRPVKRGQIQAFGATASINQKWGFDSDGKPSTGTWNEDARQRAGLALKELEMILNALGLLLPDDWPKEWSSNEPYMLNPLEVAENVWPVGVGAGERSACDMCGVHKELVYAGRFCATCADAQS